MAEHERDRRRGPADSVLGADVIGVPVDHEGMDPGALADAVALGVSAVFLQPRAQNPTGVTLTKQRAAELASVLDGCDAVIVEDDHSGDIASGALQPGSSRSGARRSRLSTALAWM